MFMVLKLFTSENMFWQLKINYGGMLLNLMLLKELYSRASNSYHIPGNCINLSNVIWVPGLMMNTAWQCLVYDDWWQHHLAIMIMCLLISIISIILNNDTNIVNSYLLQATQIYDIFIWKMITEVIFQAPFCEHHHSWLLSEHGNWHSSQDS